MLKLHLVKELRRENCEYKRYTIGDYSVDVSSMNGKIYSISVSPDYRKRDESYLPEIYYSNGEFGREEKGVKIQTTSYGSLKVEEIQKVIEGYNKALEIAEVLSAEFLAEK